MIFFLLSHPCFVWYGWIVKNNVRVGFRCYMLYSISYISYYCYYCSLFTLLVSFWMMFHPPWVFVFLFFRRINLLQDFLLSTLSGGPQWVLVTIGVRCHVNSPNIWAGTKMFHTLQKTQVQVFIEFLMHGLSWEAKPSSQDARDQDDHHIIRLPFPCIFCHEKIASWEDEAGNLSLQQLPPVQANCCGNCQGKNSLSTGELQKKSLQNTGDSESGWASQQVSPHWSI